jgi:hypothetical protein
MNIVPIKSNNLKYYNSAFNNPNRAYNTELHSKPAFDLESRLGFPTQQHKISYALNATRYNNNLISFRSNEKHLISSFLESGSSSGIYKFMCEAKDASPIQVRKFLDNILANDELAKNFIQEITQNPRKSADTVLNLTEKLGGENEFRDWYFSKGGYRESFGKYVGGYYSQTKNVDELLKLMPNWKLSDVVAKYHKSITGDVFKGGDLLMGTLPQEFRDANIDFPNLVNELRTSKNTRNGEIYTSSRQFKYNILKDSNEKLICKATPEGKNKNFIIKIDKIYSDYLYSRLRANSVYLEAMMGKYLTTNKCKDVPKFHFYDFFHNAAVFDCISGNNLTTELNPIKMNQLTPDLLALGIRTNDTHTSNYLQTNNGVMNIDLGNATYFDPLKPGDTTHTICLPSYTGLDFSNTYNVLDFAKFIRDSQKR